MQSSLTGVYWICNLLPVWAIALILFSVCINILFIGRDRLEGLPYNISFASQIGDTFLIVCILIAATVLQREHRIPYDLLQALAMQPAMAAVSCAIGLLLLLPGLAHGKPKTTMDAYHDVVIVPLFIFLLATMAPLTFCYGLQLEIYATLLLGVSWLGLVIYDGFTGRLNQSKWMCSWIREKSGIFLKQYKL